MTELRSDICIIGAGSAGLAIAAGAARMGAKTVLVEHGKMGGECLNTGCVPSKSLIAAARVATMIKRANEFGVRVERSTVDFARVHDHVQEVIARIAPKDSQDRFESLGVTVLRETARFTDPRTLQVRTTRVRSKFYVVATGSRPRVPDIPGLDRVSYLTNETIFELTAAPERLIVIGGGPVGIELAQALNRLGSAVTILEKDVLLPKGDRELVDVVRRRLRSEGIEIVEHCEIEGIERSAGRLTVAVRRRRQKEIVEVTELLIAVGREPVTDTLDLNAADVAVGRDGIEVDARLRTSNHRIFAAGDVVGPHRFTHTAQYQASIILKNALLRIPAKVDYAAAPWVTYTDPALAHVGSTEPEARERHGRVEVVRWPLAETDRAQAERKTDGIVKLVTSRRGRILGVSILAPDAGDLLQPWVLAANGRLKLSHLAQSITPYPTLAEANKQAAGKYYERIVFSAWMRRLVTLLTKLA